MDYQSYEDYMRENFGDQNTRSEDPYDTYFRAPLPETPMYGMSPMTPMPDIGDNIPEMPQINEAELNEMYPDIYKIIYPMVCKVCDVNVNVNVRITRELLDRMVEEVCSNFETNESRPAPDPAPALRNGDVVNPRAVKEDPPIETRQRNFLLDDFIRVLILRELLERRRRPPFRPPFRPEPRPPFRPGRPPMGPGRPPFRGYEELY